MPATSKHKPSIVRNLGRRHELAVAAKFGVCPIEAIPPSCRPKTATLSFPLLAKLADLALRTGTLKDFQRHLLRAWKCRLADNSPPAKELGLQPSDVVVALHHLEKTESADAARLESPRILRRASVAKPHQPTKPLPVASEPQDLPVHRLELKRSSKSAAGAKINAWASTIKRPRKSSNSVPTETDLDAMIESSEDEAPVKPTPKRARLSPSSSSLSSPTLTSLPTPQFSPRLPSKRLRTRANSPRSLQSGSSYASSPKSLQPSSSSASPQMSPQSISPYVPSPSTAARRPRRGQSGDLTRQEEHALFFKMPKGQHYKKPNPTLIDVDTVITDFEAVSYPVEVPGKKRGEFYEINNPDELRAWVEARKQSSSEHSSRSTEVSASPAPSSQQHPKQQEASRAPTPSIPVLQRVAKPKEPPTSLLPSPEPSPVTIAAPASLSPGAPSPKPSPVTIAAPVPLSPVAPSPEPSPVTMTAPVPLSPVVPSSSRQEFEVEVSALPSIPPGYRDLPHTKILVGAFNDLRKTMIKVNTAFIQSQAGQALSHSEVNQASTLMVNLLTDIASARAKYEVHLAQLVVTQIRQPSVQGPSQDATTTPETVDQTATITEMDKGTTAATTTIETEEQPMTITRTAGEQRPSEVPASRERSSSSTGFKAPYGLQILS